MKKQFVTYKIALELKELGFDEGCLAGWSIIYSKEEPDGYFLIHYDEDLRDIPKEIRWHSIKLKAPLWQQAIDWLRDEKGIHVELPAKRWINSGYKVQIKQYNKTNTLCPAVGYFESPTYNDAREEGILKAIVKIKKQIKKITTP